MKRILVTGATGFVGRFIVDGLLNEGYHIRCTVRDMKKATHLVNRCVELVKGDLSDENVAFESVRGVDAIVHAAGQLGGWGQKKIFSASNTMTTNNLLEAASRHGVKRFVYISSATSYGLQPNRVLKEDSPLKKESDPYCETKLECESLVRRYSDQFGITATILRPSIIFGPFDRHFLPIIVENVRRGTVVAIGEPNQGPPLVYVRDVAAFVSAVLFSQSTQLEIYNLSNPETASWERIIKEVAEAIGVVPLVRRIPFKIAYVAGAVLEFLWKLVRASRPPLLTRF
ncbi:MAG TPA: NAD-dependent epimerase/dehydratase family protein, partial [Bacteroidota bacterium]|nr:NAD-dependent epimerase/dehydratase family protein [Bacteroidota bacterium]